jgi:hypothetical protein
VWDLLCPRLSSVSVSVSVHLCLSLCMETLPVLLRPPVCLRPGSLSAVAAPLGAVKPAADSLQQPCKSHSGRPQGPIQACCLEPSACAHHPWFPTATPGLVPQPVPAPAPGVPFRPDVALIGGDKARGRRTYCSRPANRPAAHRAVRVNTACMHGCRGMWDSPFCGAPRILMPA